MPEKPLGSEFSDSFMEKIDKDTNEVSNKTKPVISQN